jgi:hypothetical protein
MRTLFLLVAFILMASCGKNDSVTMLYEETQCSDVWDANQTSSNTVEEAIIAYFEANHNITMTGVSIKTVSEGPFCFACNCPSGREIQVSIDEKNVSTLESEGFVRK